MHKKAADRIILFHRLFFCFFLSDFCGPLLECQISWSARSPEIRDLQNHADLLGIPEPVTSVFRGDPGMAGWKNRKKGQMAADLHLHAKAEAGLRWILAGR